MKVDGIDYMYLETRNWGKSVKFWQTLGYELVLDLGTSGRLEPSGGGSGIFLEEIGPERPLAAGVYLKAAEMGTPGPPVEVVTGPVSSHWGTRLMTVRDPDGREFVIQSPAS